MFPLHNVAVEATDIGVRRWWGWERETLMGKKHMETSVYLFGVVVKCTQLSKPTNPNAYDRYILLCANYT